MAEVTIYLKGIQYEFEKDSTYDTARNAAIEACKSEYIEDAKIRDAENELFFVDTNGQTSFVEDEGADDRKYEAEYYAEGIHQPDVSKEIDRITHKYLRNIYDLPPNLTLTMDDSYLTAPNKPADDYIRNVIKEKYGEGVNFVAYENSATLDAVKNSRDRLPVCSQMAFDKIYDVIKSNDYRTFLEMGATLEKYSTNNVALIFAQKPDAKAVMGFKAWNNHDRRITQGEKAIWIYSPILEYVSNEEQVDKFIAKHYEDPNSKEAVAKKERLMQKLMEKDGSVVANDEKTDDRKYKIGSVFDVAQTEPVNPERDNLNDIMRLDKPLNGDMQDFPIICAVFNEMNEDSSVPIYVENDHRPQDALFNAIIDYSDRALSDPAKLDDMSGITDHNLLKGDMHTIETLMSAYMICQHIGIDGGDKIGLKLADIFSRTENVMQVGRHEMFEKTFARAHYFARDFDKAFDKVYDKYMDNCYNRILQSYAGAYKFLEESTLDRDNFAWDTLIGAGDSTILHPSQAVKNIMERYVAEKGDCFSSDREVGAFAIALNESKLLMGLESQEQDLIDRVCAEKAVFDELSASEASLEETPNNEQDNQSVKVKKHADIER